MTRRERRRRCEGGAESRRWRRPRSATGGTAAVRILLRSVAFSLACPLKTSSDSSAAPRVRDDLIGALDADVARWPARSSSLVLSSLDVPLWLVVSQSIFLLLQPLAAAIIIDQLVARRLRWWWANRQQAAATAAPTTTKCFQQVVVVVMTLLLVRGGQACVGGGGANKRLPPGPAASSSINRLRAAAAATTTGYGN